MPEGGLPFGLVGDPSQKQNGYGGNTNGQIAQIDQQYADRVGYGFSGYKPVIQFQHGSEIPNNQNGGNGTQRGLQCGLLVLAGNGGH